MPRFSDITEADLQPIKANVLKPGYIFYLKQDNGEFHKCEVDLAWVPTPRMLEEYKKGLKKFSQEGKLFARRDKPGHDFREVL